MAARRRRAAARRKIRLTPDLGLNYPTPSGSNAGESGASGRRLLPPVAPLWQASSNWARSRIGTARDDVRALLDTAGARSAAIRTSLAPDAIEQTHRASGPPLVATMTAGPAAPPDRPAPHTEERTTLDRGSSGVLRVGGPSGPSQPPRPPRPPRRPHQRERFSWRERDWRENRWLRRIRLLPALLAGLLLLALVLGGAYELAIRGVGQASVSVSSPLASSTTTSQSNPVIIQAGGAEQTPTPIAPAYTIGVWVSNTSPPSSGAVTVFVRVSRDLMPASGIPVTILVQVGAGGRNYGPVKTDSSGLAKFTVRYSTGGSTPVFVTGKASVPGGPISQEISFVTG